MGKRVFIRVSPVISPGNNLIIRDNPHSRSAPHLMHMPFCLAHSLFSYIFHAAPFCSLPILFFNRSDISLFHHICFHRTHTRKEAFALSDYRRFISYLYEYKNEKKTYNRGFLKAEAKGGIFKLEIHIKDSGLAASVPFRFSALPAMRINSQEFFWAARRPLPVPLDAVSKLPTRI